VTRGEEGAPAFLSRRFSLASRGAFGAALGGGDGNDEDGDVDDGDDDDERLCAIIDARP
jgi:hypothetical protein